MNNYIGNKDFSNVIHFLINHLPKSDRYFSLFFGGGGLENSKFTAEANFICSEIDPDCKKYEVPPQSIIQFLNYKDLLESFVFTPADFIFADPPYLLSSIRARKNYYKFGFTDHDHIEFLNYIRSSPARVMLTHPESKLYSSMLSGWYQEPFTYMTRGGLFHDTLYTNYSLGSGIELLNYSCLGRDFTDRQRIKRQRFNIINKFKNLDPLIRKAIFKEFKKNDLW